MKFRYGAAVVAAIAALSLTACAGGGGTAPEPSASAEDVISLTIAVLPIGATAPVQIAIAEGIFEKHGLNVEVSQGTTGSAIVPSVLNGAVDIGYGNLISTIQANSQGLPIVSIASSDASAVSAELDTNWIMVRSDSGIKTVDDLAGKTVAVNALNGLVHLFTAETIDELGGDSSSVQFTEIPFPDMLAALEGNRVDAISTTEPFRTIGVQNPDNVAIAPVTTIGGTRLGLTFDTYFTSEDFLKNNEEAVKRFREAIYEAQQLAIDQPEVARAAILTYLKIPEPIVASMHLQNWVTETVSEEDFQFTADLMVKFGLLSDSEVPAYGDLIRE